MNVDLRRRSTGRPSAYRPGRLDDAAVVPQVALLVEHRHVEPAVVRTKAGRPDDRPDLAAAQIELQPRRRRHAGRLEALGRADVGVAAVRARPLVERVEQALHLEIGEREHVAQAAREQRAAVAHRGEPADELDADRAERVEIERGPLRRADELRRRQPARARQVVDLVVALVPHAGRVHPPQHVAAAIGARQPHVLADRQRHGPAGAVDLVGQLHAGRRRADDEHAAFGQVAGIAVVERRELQRSTPARPAQRRHARRRCRRRSRSPRCGSGARRVLVATSIAVVGRPHRRDRRCACAPARATRAAKRVDEVDHLGHRHVAVGVRAVVAHGPAAGSASWA